MFVNPPASGEIGAKVMSGASSSQVTSSGQQSGLSQTINPKYEAWLVVDQLLLGWLYNSMTLEIATQVMGYEKPKDLLEAI